MTNKPVICIGAAIVDDSFFCQNVPVPGTSNPSTHFRSAGGVARNIAHHLVQLGHPVELISHFGIDNDGKWLEEKCSSAGIGLSHSRFISVGTGHFTAILSPGGELFIGASDTHLESEITISFLAQKTPFLKTASVLLIDCNLSVSCLEWLVEFCREHAIPCVIEPVSVAKAARLSDINLKNVLLLTPNRDELSALCGEKLNKNSESPIEHLLKKGVQKIWMRRGEEGSTLFSREETITLPAPDVKVLDTTGAGDAALAGWIHAWLKNKSPKECMIYGHVMAELLLQTKGTNSELLNEDLLESKIGNRITQ